jgi:hypothetical protein
MNSPNHAAGAVLELSVYSEARKAQAEHKWLASEQAGYDLGDQAVHEWTRSHWLKFYRWRFVQHVRGQFLFCEFHPKTFGVIHRGVNAPRELLDTILDMVCEGAENWPLIWWALERQHPIDQVVEILDALDINSQRLAPPAEARDA